MKYICFLFFILVSVSVFSQTGGESLYPFLNVPTSAKQISLGGVTLTSRDDVSQTLWNPSSVNTKMENDISVNYVKYISGINVGSLSYAKSINPQYGTAFLGVQYLDYGNLYRTNANGPTVLGTFSSRDLSVNLGYGYTLENVTFGVTLKYVTSKIDIYTSSALLYDLGVTYVSPTKPLVMSLVLRNSGKQLTRFMNNKEPVKNNAIFAIEYRLEHVPVKLYGAIDELNNWNISSPNPSRSITDLEGNVIPEKISRVNNALRHVSVGAELWPGKMINLRVGYNQRKSQEYQLNRARTGAGLTYGFGLNTKYLRFDYAYAKFQQGAKYSTFGLTIHL